MKKDSTPRQYHMRQSLKQTLCEIYDTLFPADCLFNEKQLQIRRYLFSFGTPMVMMMLVYCSIGAWPFIGPNSPLVLDMNGQYVYFFANLRNIILGDNSLLYSWSRSLGGEFLGMYAYYLASPISWIAIFFPADMITEAIWLMLVLKTGICGLTMSVFLDKVYPTRSLNTVLFSTLYAFCAYNLAYMSNIMWMDGVMLLPLLMLGLERLMKERKFKLYTITLSLIILSNYYIGFMICIFVVLYFIYYHIVHGNNTIGGKTTERYYYLKSLVRLGLFSIISALMAAVIIFPAYYSLQFGKVDYGNIVHSHVRIQNLTDLVSKLFFGHFDTIRPDGSPFVYCGILVLMTMPMFFISKRIRLRDKLGSIFLLTVLGVSMVIPEVDVLWHGGQAPNWMNFRYSFLFSFLLIVFAYRGFNCIDDTDKKLLPAVSVVLLIYVGIISWLDYGERYIYAETFQWNYNRFVLVANIFIVIILAIILWIYRKTIIEAYNHAGDNNAHKNVRKRGPAICLAVCVLMEAYAAGVLQNTALAMDVGYSSRDSYVDFIHATQPAVDYIYQHDDSFYRMEKTFYRMANDNMALDMRGISGSTSTMNSTTLNLLKHLGYSSSAYISWYYGGNPVNDSLIGIKYIISDSSGCEKQKLSDFYNLVYEDETNDRYVFENPYALSIAFAANDDILKVGKTLYDAPFEMLNAIFKSADGFDTTVFHQMDVTTSDVIREEHIHTECENDEHNHNEESECGGHYVRSYTCLGTGEPVYLHFTLYSGSDLHIFLNGESVELTTPLDCSAGIISLGRFEAGKTYEIVMYAEREELLPVDGKSCFYALNMVEFQRASEAIRKNQLDKVSDFSEVRITGTVTITEEKPILFTTIPYDKNWQIYMDGKQVQSTLALDSLLAVKLPPGEHEILFRYQSTEFILGGMVSLFGFVFFGSMIFMNQHKKRRCEVIDDC